jgi:RimJ/RimL family protein N-acetyltransferase
MSFNFNQDLVLEDERVLLRALQNSDVEHLLKFLSMNRKGLSSEGKRKENLTNYIQLAIVARENKTQFPFIVFDKKLGKYAGSTRFMISITAIRFYLVWETVSWYWFK